MTTMMTTLLLVLATTAALFFDLAAATRKVMMFMPGDLDLHNWEVGLRGILTEKSDDPTKIEVLNPELKEDYGHDRNWGQPPGTWPSAPALVHAVFGTNPRYKWYTAVKALNAVAKASAGAVITNDADGNYYVFKGPSGTTIRSSEWNGTVTLDPEGNASPKEMAWIALVWFKAGTGLVQAQGCTVISVHINEEPSFRAGPMRQAGYKGRAVLLALIKHSQIYVVMKIDSIDSTTASNARLFYGYGTFENAKVAMNVHFQVTGKAVAAGNAIVSAAGFVYEDFAKSKASKKHKALTSPVSPYYIYIRNLEGDAHSLGWVAAYDVSLRKFAFYQKMTHMGDGFHNGKLTMGTSGDATTVGLEGTIVFASRDDNKFTLYLPTFKAKDGLDAIRGFYGKKPWSADMETALDAICTTPADDAANEIYLSTTTFNADGETKITNNVVNKDPGLFKFDLKTGDKCGMVKWVAFRQTSGGKKYLAHRDMMM